MKAGKKPIPVQVEFASVSSEIQTEEGPVQCASGDALMTGAAGVGRLSAAGRLDRHLKRGPSVGRGQ